MRMGVGLVAMMAVLALVVVMTMAGSNGGSDSVSAVGPTPTTGPNPGTDGFLSGIYDLEVNPGANALYHCIIRTDHDAGTNRIGLAASCFGDLPGLGDPANVLDGVIVPGEGPDGISGPPPPPPYATGAAYTGVGEYFPGGDALCSGASSCIVSFICVPDLGAGLLGPNLLARFIIPDPSPSAAQLGTAELFPGASVKQCDSLDPTGLTALGGLLDFGMFTPGSASETSWRTAAGSATDFDGDGCSDLEELDVKSRPANCGDDPYSPLDSNIADLSGSYSLLTRVARADVAGGGAYFSCLADIQQTGDGTTDGDITARLFCYQDSFSVINSLGYPGVTGDGYSGGGPPYAAIPAVGDPETDCSRFGNAATLDDDGDGIPNDGCPSEGFGDTDSSQTELTGFLDTADNTLKLRGCFEDEDASGTLINVYIESVQNPNTGIGTVDIWALQDLSDCTGSHAWGSYGADTGAELLEAFDDALLTSVRQPGGQSRDTDQDGCPNASELRDDPAIGGLRDPYNPYDWYDVNQDGVIDLFGDILGVISHYSLDGADPYDAIYDRGAPITGGAGSWSRRAPDGVIDLFTDILGVISQYSLTGCI
ncbi:MAG: hypothetical protein IIC90_10160 [Chloroflexi bacterium]|nr:hypothetical protein [Chloroflexota bacterium]